MTCNNMYTTPCHSTRGIHVHSNVCSLANNLVGGGGHTAAEHALCQCRAIDIILSLCCLCTSPLCHDSSLGTHSTIATRGDVRKQHKDNIISTALLLYALTQSVLCCCYSVHTTQREYNSCSAAVTVCTQHKENIIVALLLLQCAHNTKRI